MPRSFPKTRRGTNVGKHSCGRHRPRCKQDNTRKGHGRNQSLQRIPQGQGSFPESAFAFQEKSSDAREECPTRQARHEADRNGGRAPSEGRRRREMPLRQDFSSAHGRSQALPRSRPKSGARGKDRRRRKGTPGQGHSRAKAGSESFFRFRSVRRASALPSRPRQRRKANRQARRSPPASRWQRRERRFAERLLQKARIGG